MQCGLPEATNIYIYTEKLQELYLNFCTSSLYLSSQQLFHAVSGCDVLQSWDREAECLACGHTGGIPTSVFPVLSCSSFPWDCQGWNFVPCFLGSNTSVAAGAQRQDGFQCCALYFSQQK